MNCSRTRHILKQRGKTKKQDYTLITFILQTVIATFLRILHIRYVLKVAASAMVQLDHCRSAADFVTYGDPL